MRSITAILLCLLLTGCATTAGYEAILRSWIGNNESSLVSSWGAPQNSYVMANGDKAIEYIKQQNVQMGGNTYYQPVTTYQSGNINTMSNVNSRSNFNTYGDLNMTGNINSYGNVNTMGSYSGTSTTYVPQTASIYNIQMICKTTFIIDSTGIIQNWRWEGNSCRAVMPSNATKTSLNLRKGIRVDYESLKIKVIKSRMTTLPDEYFDLNEDQKTEISRLVRKNSGE